VAATHGSQDVKEANLELQIPLLTGLPLAKALDFAGAFRYTDYSTSGPVHTWKLGLTYQPFEDLHFRANRSRDIRAPSVYELFAGRSVSITGFTDLHTSTGGFTNVATQGNPNLKPEEADTTTVGFVYTPSWVPGLSFAVDYYKIEIGNAIAPVGGNNASVQQACETSGGTSPVCALYIRPLPFSDRTAANYPTLIITQNLNIAQTSTHGVDFELAYRTNLPVGTFDARLLTSYQPELLTCTLPTAQLINLAGAASIGPGTPAPAKIRSTLNLTYGIDKLAINTQIRYLSSLKPSGDPTLVYTDSNIPSFVYVDLSVTRDFDINGHPFTPGGIAGALLPAQRAR